MVGVVVEEAGVAGQRVEEWRRVQEQAGGGALGCGGVLLVGAVGLAVVEAGKKEKLKKAAPFISFQGNKSVLER